MKIKDYIKQIRETGVQQDLFEIAKKVAMEYKKGNVVFGRVLEWKYLSRRGEIPRQKGIWQITEHDGTV